MRIVISTCVLSLMMVTIVSAYSVDNTLDLPDTNPGDLVCEASNGHCTLRGAIEECNAGVGWERISFLAHDQVGRSRPYLNSSDIGAFETGPSEMIFDDGFENGMLYWSAVVGQ